MQNNKLIFIYNVFSKPAIAVPVETLDEYRPETSFIHTHTTEHSSSVILYLFNKKVT